MSENRSLETLVESVVALCRVRGYERARNPVGAVNPTQREVTLISEQPPDGIIVVVERRQRLAHKNANLVAL